MHKFVSSIPLVDNLITDLLNLNPFIKICQIIKRDKYNKLEITLVLKCVL